MEKYFGKKIKINSGKLICKAMEKLLGLNVSMDFSPLYFSNFANKNTEG